MKNNVKKVLVNSEDLQSLDVKANKIKDNANLFKKDAVALQRKTCFQNFKWTLILSVLIIVILLIIIVPLVTSGSKGGNNGDEKPPQGMPPSDNNSSLNKTNLIFLN